MSRRENLRQLKIKQQRHATRSAPGKRGTPGHRPVHQLTLNEESVAVKLSATINPTRSGWPWVTKKVSASRIVVPVNFEEMENAMKLADWMATQTFWNTMFEQKMSYATHYSTLCVGLSDTDIEPLGFARAVFYLACRGLGIPIDSKDGKQP